MAPCAHRRIRNLLFGFLMTAAPVMAHAQGGDGQDLATGSNKSGVGLQDIVVTARRSTENVQTVPVTVAAFDSASLRDANVRETQDLMFSVPGVYLTGSGSKENATYAIRGQSRPNAGSGQPGVVTYFAEVPLPNFGNSSLTYDLSSVQVLKGPQGTLFGRNTTGGAVLLEPTGPSYNLGGYVQGTIGNYDLRDLEGALNLPIVSDRIALRVAGRFSRRDGTTKNLGAGGDLDNIHSDQVRISLLVEPTDWLKNTTIFDYRDTDQRVLGGVLVEVNPRADEIGVGPLLRQRLAEQQARGIRTVDYGSFISRSQQRHSILVNRTNIDLGAVELVNIFSYQSLRWNFDTNPDALPDPIGVVDATNIYNNRQTTDEVQLRGNLFDDKLNWLLGGFYYRNVPGDLNLSNFPTFFGLVPNQARYVYQRDTSKALFANLNYDLGFLLEGLGANAGFRYTWDKTAGCGGSGERTPPYSVTPDNCSVTNPVLTPGTSFDLVTKSSAPTWTMGMDWKVNRDVFLYFTSRRGYRAGGLNFPQLGPAIRDQQSFKPEKVTDFELGLKSEWRIGDVRGRFNIAGFLTKASQVQYPLSGVSTQPGCVAGDPVLGIAPYSPDGDCNPANDPALSALLINAGSTTVKGIEFDLLVSPLAGLQLTAGGTILGQKTDKFTAPPYLDVYGAAAQGEVPFYYSPRQSYTVGIHYDVPFPERLGKLGFGFNTYWTGAVQLGGYRAKAYSLSNARIDWDNIGGSPIDLGFFAKNLFDKNAVISGANTSPGGPLYAVIFSEPRTYGVQLRIQFGD